MNRGPEILAPAGSMEALRAAVECGADAVYLGAGNFNARRHAKNFTEEELAEAIEYCHVRGVKVHLTLNTLAADEELSGVLQFLETACTLGIDALIVQDLGVARLARKCCPDMELHASTQMAVMTPDGFRLLAGLGFSRAVLPRELSLKEIIEIRETTKDTGLELEMFIHGALCMCVSGQCYLSAMMGGRSGNRGLCAQPCRLPFSAGDSNDHALSLKDLSAVEAIPELYEAGVLSFKIEGRMKRPEYVAAAVTACRNAVAGIEDKELEENLNAVFSRSGHTDGYLEGRLGHDMFGTRRKDDVVAAAPILKDLETLYRKDTRGTFVSFEFTARLGERATLKATWENVWTVYIVSEHVVEPAQKAAATPEKVTAQLMKTGGTGFVTDEEHITVTIDDNVFLPVSLINELRRKVLEGLTDHIAEEHKVPFDRTLSDSMLDGNVTAEPKEPYFTGKRIARLSTPDQLPENCGDIRFQNTVWLLPLDTPSSLFDALSIQNVPFGVEIPRGLYQSTERYRELLHTAKEHGAQFAYAGTLDGVAMAQSENTRVLGGFTLNIFNSLARREYAAMGVLHVVLSQELKLSQAGQIAKGKSETGLLTYGNAPLMLTRNAPDGVDAYRTELTDRKGVTFPVQPNGDAFELLNSRPLYLADRQKGLRQMDFQLLWFTTETEADVADILENYEQELPAEGEFTRGLYYKGVL